MGPRWRRYEYTSRVYIGCEGEMQRESKCMILRPMQKLYIYEILHLNFL